MAPNEAGPDRLALLRGVSRSFYLSIRLLPAPLREPVGLAYLLARAADTVADTAHVPFAQRAATLDALAASVAAGTVLDGGLREQLAAFVALQADGEERRLLETTPRLLEALDALAADDRDRIRQVLTHITSGQMLDLQRFDPAACRALADAAELERYTYLVAGSVGEFWTDLCEAHLGDFAALPAGEMRALGRAYGCGLQLVNILRDTHADLAAGRCYFPADELAAAGLTPQDACADPQRLAPVWRRWHGQALAQLASGLQYAQALHARRLRLASGLPALLGVRTLALLDEAGPAALTRTVKMRRGEVRGLLLRLVLAGVSRTALVRESRRLGAGRPFAGWENPAR